MKKYDLGSIVTIESAQIIKSLGAAVVVTDGKFLEIVKEDKDGKKLCDSLQ
jgi:hypothetical protein